MRRWDPSCYALTIGVALALLAGCGGLQSAVGPSNGASANWTDQQQSPAHNDPIVNSPKASANEDLLYVGTAQGAIHIFSYPHHKLVRTLRRFAEQAEGLCSDSAGDVFVTSPNDGFGTGGKIFELAHVGGKPIATLTDAGTPLDCAVDPTTGDLAVANPIDTSTPSESGDIAIYPKAQGTPTIYLIQGSPYPGFCGYDNHGNLFVGTSYGPFILSELPKGSSSFTNINVSGFPTGPGASSVQWDGAHVAIAHYPNAKGKLTIYQVQISGTTGSIVNTTTIKSRRSVMTGQIWIQNGIVSAIQHNGKQAAYWDYPAGGYPQADTTIARGGTMVGITVSLAPTARDLKK